MNALPRQVDQNTQNADKTADSFVLDAQTQDKQSQLTLELLQAIEQYDDISQRHLAQEMGVALGLANSYLKRCVKKGWIKMTTAPANRYLYYLTPTGFAEKARLTADFFSTSLALFRQSGDAYTQLFNVCLENGNRRILLVGLSDLTEIAYTRSLACQLEVVAVYQPDVSRNDFFGLSVVGDIPSSHEFDCAVVTAMEQTNQLVSHCESVLNDEKIMIPRMLLNMNYRNNESPKAGDRSTNEANE